MFVRSPGIARVAPGAGTRREVQPRRRRGGERRRGRHRSRVVSARGDDGSRPGCLFGRDDRLRGGDSRRWSGFEGEETPLARRRGSRVRARVEFEHARACATPRVTRRFRTARTFGVLPVTTSSRARRRRGRSVDARRVVPKVASRRAEIWNAKIFAPTSSLPLGPDAAPVHEVAFNHNGKMLATAGADGAVRLFDLNAGKQIMSWTRASEGRGGDEPRVQRRSKRRVQRGRTASSPSGVFIDCDR